MARDERQSYVVEHDGRPDGAESVLRAFLIADVRGYTRFTNERGDEAGAELARRFAEVTRAGVSAHGGEVIELRGDEALAVFASPRQAVRAAVEVQRRLRGVEDPAEALLLGVGVGIDAGEAVPIEDGYRGSALNVAARLCSLAGPGDILATETLSSLAGRLPGVSYSARKPVRVKGIEQPVRLVEIVPEGGLPPLPVLEQPATRRGLPRLGLLAAAAGAAVVAGGAAFLLLGSESRAAALEANSLGRLDTSSGAVAEQVPVGQGPADVVYGDGSLWVVSREEGELWQVNPATNAVADTIPAGAAPVAAAFGDEAVWVVDPVGRKVLRIADGEIQDDADVGNGASDVAFAGGAAWVANTVDGTVSRVDAASGRVSTIAAGNEPVAVVGDSEAVWVANRGSDEVVRIDLDTEAVDSVSVGHEPSALAIGGGSVWVANAADGTVSQIEPPGRVTDTIDVGARPTALAFADGSLWAASDATGAVARIREGEVSTEQVGGSPTALAEANGDLWVTALAARATHRGGTLRISGPFPITDPYFQSFGANVNPILNDGLVGFRATGGPGGTALVPNLASAMPTRSSDGLRYTFRLRRGIRYSTGAEVKASHVRASFERMFRIRSDGARWFAALLGGTQCIKTPRRCDLAKTVLTDDDEGTVEFVLERPDPLFLYSLAYPPAWVLPPNVPQRRVETEPLPATGPYVISEVEAGRSMTLVRNPHFREWSREAQPAGYPERIVIAPPRQENESLALVRTNRADTLVGDLPAPEIERIAVRTPTRLHSVPENSVVYAVLNTRRPPFDDPRARRALSFAVDREAAVRALGGSLFGRPVCQMIPPNVLGFRPRCRYTAAPQAGVWSAPDLGAARQLVRAAGTAGSAVTVWTSRWQPLRGVGDVLVDALRTLGYRPRLRVVGGTIFDYYEQLVDPARGAQVGSFRWGLDFPVPVDVFGPLLTCSSPNATHFCDRELDRRIERATASLGGPPTAAAERWAELDEEVAERAVVVPLANQSRVELVSERAGNVQLHPVWGVMYSQMWVR